MGGWWRWALVSPDGVAFSRMVGVSASVNLPLHHKVQKFSSGTGSPGWPWKRGHITAVCVCVCVLQCLTRSADDTKHVYSLTNTSEAHPQTCSYAASERGIGQNPDNSHERGGGLS